MPGVFILLHSHFVVLSLTVKNSLHKSFRKMVHVTSPRVTYEKLLVMVVGSTEVESRLLLSLLALTAVHYATSHLPLAVA